MWVKTLNGLQTPSWWQLIGDDCFALGNQVSFLLEPTNDIAGGF